MLESGASIKNAVISIYGVKDVLRKKCTRSKLIVKKYNNTRFFFVPNEWRTILILSLQ